MHYLLPFIIAGITTGAIYGMAATGLVLTYKTSGIFNFAHGSAAAVAVFVFYYLRTEHNWPWPAAAVISVLLLGPAMGLLLALVARLLEQAGHVLKIAATVGILTAVLAIGNIWYGSATTSFPDFLPTSTVRIFGLYVGWNQIIEIIISLIACGGLYCFFRYMRLGMAMRAVVDDPALLATTAQSPAAVRRWAWIIGSTFAALSGILIAPGLGLDGVVLTELIIQAFGAAAIGYFSSLPLTYVGGLVVGIAGSIATKYVADVPSLAGLPVSLPFIILFLVLIVTPRKRLAVHRYVPNIQLGRAYYAPMRVRVAFGILAIVFLSLLPSFVGTNLALYSSALADVILLLSLGLLVKVSGQVSLCQYAFAAVGAAAMGHFMAGAHIPWLLSLVLATIIVVPVGAIIAIPAIRLSGVFLALATLGFGFVLQQMFYTMGFMFGPTASGIAVPRPDVRIGPLDLSSDAGMYYVTLVFVVLSAIATVAMMRGRLGRMLGAMSDSPVALETLGANANVSRVLVFCISSAMAAVAGILTASQLNFATGSEFDPFASLVLVALIVIVPFGAPWYAVVAAFGLAVLPGYINSGNITDYLNILFGVSAVLAPVTLARHPGAPKAVRRLAERLDGWMARVRLRPAAGHAAASVLTVGDSAGPRSVVLPPDARRTAAGIEVKDLTVTYGGLAAVRDLSINAPAGVITGLIGPNGAGKTTTFNAICGLAHPSRGRILAQGRDVSRLGPSARARRGVGRTFQRVQLFESVTVRENIELGSESKFAGGSPLSQLYGRRMERMAIESAAAEAIELTGVGGLAHKMVGELTTGQRRLVELARVLAGRFDMILLDEPSAGLDRFETREFGHTLQRIVSERGIGMLVVEHDMSLIRQVCDHVWVLDFGELIFDGSVTQMLASEVVKAAYLGADDEVVPVDHQPAPQVTGSERERSSS
jgi:ABC-type branched-subunit amino acid transport system ATPase component/branched-subunit amino acid ABC-type transport system permease component